MCPSSGEATVFTRSDQKVPKLIFLLCCGYTSGHPFAGRCPRTPSLPRTMVGPSVPLSSLWASVEDSRVPVPCYCSWCAGCRQSKSSTCSSSFVWNREEIVRRLLKSWELPSVSSVWAVTAFSNGTRDLKKAETQLMTIRSLTDRRQAKLTTVSCKCENWSKQIGT